MNWYAIRSTPRGELRADAELAAAGITRFTPTFSRMTQIRYTKGRSREIVHPLMPGYLFAQLDFSPTSHHPSLLDGCRHVIEPISIQGKPVPILTKELDQLRLLCGAGAFDQGRQRGQDNRFRAGDTVRVSSGVWAGFVMKFRDTASGAPKPRMGYVRLVMERLFGQAGFEIDVPQELVEAA